MSYPRGNRELRPNSHATKESNPTPCREAAQSNEAMHRMSGTHIRSRFGWLRMPFIGDLGRVPE